MATTHRIKELNVYTQSNTYIYVQLVWFWPKIYFQIKISTHSKKLMLVYGGEDSSLQQIIFFFFLEESDFVVLFSNKVIPRDGVCLQDQLWGYGTFLKHISV